VEAEDCRTVGLPAGTVKEKFFMAGDTAVLEPAGKQSFNRNSCSAAHNNKFKKWDHSPQISNKRYCK
jgi:hypothetical protein